MAEVRQEAKLTRQNNTDQLDLKRAECTWILTDNTGHCGLTQNSNSNYTQHNVTFYGNQSSLTATVSQ